MKVIIISHPSRAAHVLKLQEHLDVAATVVDTISAKSGHMTALRLAAQHDERVAIMEDDAIPVQDFGALSDKWAQAHPNELISFYLGTSRPIDFQPLVSRRIVEAEMQNKPQIWMPTLLHGVCYSVPRQGLADMLTRLNDLARIREADFAVGAAWGKPVCYPIESLVQHRDETPVERHPDRYPRTEPRVARRLAGTLMFNS